MKYTELTPAISAALECAKAQYLATRKKNKTERSYLANPKQLEELFAALKQAGAAPNSSNNAHLNNGLLDLTIIGPSDYKEYYATVFFKVRYLHELSIDVFSIIEDERPATSFLDSIAIMLGAIEFDFEQIKATKIKRATVALELAKARLDEWGNLLFSPQAAGRVKDVFSVVPELQE